MAAVAVVDSAAPKLSPVTVTTAAPLVGALARPTKLSTGASDVNSAGAVPTIDPTVSLARTVRTVKTPARSMPPVVYMYIETGAGEHTDMAVDIC